MSEAIIIEIPRVPPSLNDLRGRKYRNPHDYKRLRELWAMELAVKFSASERRKLFEASRDRVINGKKVAVTIIARRKRLLDQDNLAGGVKPVLDAMKEFLIFDDSPKHIDLKVEQVKCGSARQCTVISVDS